METPHSQTNVALQMPLDRNAGSRWVVRREPEHSSLAAYLADNPRPPCPLVCTEHPLSCLYSAAQVGLAWITEFRPAGPGRPHYHCSLPNCRDEQGTARQMMDHLIRLAQ